MAVAVEQSPYFAERARHDDLILKDIPRFDLENYIGNYEGYTRLARLHHIARLSPPLASECLRIAIPEAKSGKHTTVYTQLTGLMHEIEPGNPLGDLDKDWVARKKIENQRTTDKLETELRGYKNMLISESIRMGQADLGNHLLALHDFDNAQKAYQKMREVCVYPVHIAEMVLKLIYSHIANDQWAAALTQCQKADTLSLDPQQAIKVHAAATACTGLIKMTTGNYSAAATKFLVIDSSYASDGPVGGLDFSKSVITCNDIAVYGGLCALATRSRSFLQHHLSDQTNFRDFLVLEPQIRRAFKSFCDGKYTDCLAVLEAYRTDFLLDIHLHAHVDALFRLIRSRCITQYVTPFSAVSIPALQSAFPQPAMSRDHAMSMEDELVHMIQRGGLRARVDAVGHTLILLPEVSKSAHQSTLELAETTERSLRLKLHTTELYEAGLELNDTRNRHAKRPYTHLF